MGRDQKLTEAEGIEFRRRYDAATAALSQARPQWERLDQIEARKGELSESSLRKVELALFFGGAVLQWFLADGRKWDFNAGMWAMIVAAWMHLIYRVDFIFLMREEARLSATNAQMRFHWASALGGELLFWRFNDCDRRRRKAGLDLSDEARAAFEKEEKEIWAEAYKQLRFRASGKPSADDLIQALTD